LRTVYGREIKIPLNSREEELYRVVLVASLHRPFNGELAEIARETGANLRKSDCKES